MFNFGKLCTWKEWYFIVIDYSALYVAAVSDL